MIGQQRSRLADGLASTEVGRRQVLQAFVVTPVIVVLDKARDMTSRAGPRVRPSAWLRERPRPSKESIWPQCNSEANGLDCLKKARYGPFDSLFVVALESAHAACGQ